QVSLATLLASNTFATEVYPRNESVQTIQLKTNLNGCYCPQSAGLQVSRFFVPHLRARLQIELQGSNISSGCPVARATGTSLNSLIKEDHLLACTTRMFECALFTRQACKYDDLDLSRPPGTP